MPRAEHGVLPDGRAIMALRIAAGGHSWTVQQAGDLYRVSVRHPLGTVKASGYTLTTAVEAVRRLLARRL